MRMIRPDHFNDLLEEYGVPLNNVKLLRNQDRRLKGRSVYELWKNYRPQFEYYQSIQRARRRFAPDSHVASFVADPEGRTIFAGLYYVEGSRLATDADKSPVEEARVQPNDIIHTMRRLPVMEQLEGELEIDWGRGFKATVQYARNKNKPILSIPDILDDLGKGDGTTDGGASTIDNLGTSDFDSKASMLDQRQRTMQEVVARLGQDEFRTSLMRAYSKRCAITACSVPEVLEAAHITPYTGDASNHVCNGLLLRSDIHQLFDALLITVDPESYAIVIAPRLRGTIYEKLAGRKIRLPQSVSQHPSEVSLRYHLSRASL